MCVYICGQVTHKVSCLGEGSHPASRLYESGSNDRKIAGIQCIELCYVSEDTRLAVERQQVVIDPEPEAHVWIEQQVGNGTTRYVSVLVDVAFAVRNRTTARRGSTTIRSTQSDVRQGMLMNMKVNETSEHLRPS